LTPEVRDIVIDVIKTRHPREFQFAHGNSFKDDAGNRIHVHPDSIVWETVDWLDYEVLDRINERLERDGLPFVAEYGNSYEVLIEEV